MSNVYPEWYFPHDLVVEEPEWHKIVLFAGGNPDQASLLFMRVDSIDEGVAIVGLDEDHVTQIRDHLTRWLEWNKKRWENIGGQ